MPPLTPLLLPTPRAGVLTGGELAPARRWILCLPNSERPLLGHALGQLRDALQPHGITLDQAQSSHDPAAFIKLASDGSQPPEGFHLSIDSPDRISLSAANTAGFFYGLQALIQLVEIHGPALPCLRIDDAPDFPVRGVYMDLARGKVPTLDTLFEIVRWLARFRVNQLQLYVEHTFAFEKHPDIWAGADPLTAADVAALDAHCRAHFIELVPSLSCFGHFCTPLRSARKSHLNELELDASSRPFSWWDRMAHFTLDPRNPDSFTLVSELISEFRNCHSSALFNICCDETFDLGKGRSQQAAEKVGVGKLYLDFVNKLCAHVRSLGATPMLWADIIGKHPEIAPELDPDAILLEWGYSPEINQDGIDRMQQSGRPFYVCPGCSGWNRFAARWDHAWLNISRMARAGKAAGAIGLLNTDWGDKGHVNTLGQSLYGYLAGAAAGWNASACDPDDPASFDNAFNHHVLRAPGLEHLNLFREGATLDNIAWGGLAFLTDPTADFPDDWFDTPYRMPNTILKTEPAAVAANFQRLNEITADLAHHPAPAPPPPHQLPELPAGLEGVRQHLAPAQGFRKVGGRELPIDAPSGLDVADDWRRFDATLARLWHARNRPSEYCRVRLAILDTAARLDRIALNRPPS